MKIFGINFNMPNSFGIHPSEERDRDMQCILKHRSIIDTWKLVQDWEVSAFERYGKFLSDKQYNYCLAMLDEEEKKEALQRSRS